MRARPPPRRSGSRCRLAALRCALATSAAATSPSSPGSRPRLGVRVTPEQRGIEDPRPAVLVDKMAN
eukprot:3748399-Alexandrium_andersonii.AAC.1